MIELFDPARLAPRRDNTLTLALALLVGAGAVIGGRHHYLQQQLRAAQGQSATLATAVQGQKALVQPAPAQALVDELTQTAQRLEAEVQALGGQPGGLKASQWLERLGALAQADIGLLRVDLDRQGQALVEGQARDPQAVARYVQAWERQAASSPLRSRALEVRDDPKAAVLRFQLRATVPGVGAAPPATPVAASGPPLQAMNPAQATAAAAAAAAALLNRTEAPR